MAMDSEKNQVLSNGLNFVLNSTSAAERTEEGERIGGVSVRNKTRIVNVK